MKTQNSPSKIKKEWHWIKNMLGGRVMYYFLVDRRGNIYTEEEAVNLGFKK